MYQPHPLPPLRPTRRAVLGAGLGGTAAVALAVTGAAPTTAASSQKATPVSDRHVLLTSFSGSGFDRGVGSGTQRTAAGLVIGSPTATRSYTDPFGGPAVAYESASWLSPVVAAPFALTELVSSWAADTPGRTWVEVLVRGTDDTGTQTGWFVLGRWCSHDPDDGGAIHRTSVNGQGTAVAMVWTDTLHLLSKRTLRDWQLQVNLLRPTGATGTPTVRLLAAMASAMPKDGKVPVSPTVGAPAVTLDVPTLSQEVHRGHYPQWDNGGEAWCSATCTAMVLRYWQTGPTAADTSWVTTDPPNDAVVDFAARNVFDYTYDGAGNWPFNTAYAARYGLEAFVTRLRSLTEAEQLVRAGIPLVASVSFGKNELDGAGYGSNGHLLVIVGFTETGDVVVNDPASHLLADDSQVRTVYRRDQFENVWVPRSGGIVYVIHPPSVPLPPPPGAEPNW